MSETKNPRGDRCKNCGRRDASVRKVAHFGTHVEWCERCKPAGVEEAAEKPATPKKEITKS